LPPPGTSRPPHLFDDEPQSTSIPSRQNRPEPEPRAACWPFLSNNHDPVALVAATAFIGLNKNLRSRALLRLRPEGLRLRLRLRLRSGREQETNAKTSHRGASETSHPRLSTYPSSKFLTPSPPIDYSTGAPYARCLPQPIILILSFLRYGAARPTRWLVRRLSITTTSS
jgi:hypothetical protein